MKKTLKNIGIYLVGILLLASCFDDDGNYTYLQDENAIVYGFKYQSYAYYKGWGDCNVYVGDTVTFIPQIANDSIIDTTLYRWEYYVQPYGLVCTTRVMKHVFHDVKTAQSLNGICRAINTKTGLSYRADLVLKFLNRWDKGWLVLTDHNNTSKINLLKSQDTVWVEDSDLTQLINGVTLGSGPKKLIFNPNQRVEVRVLQNSGDVILQNIAYHQLGTFVDEFGGAYPTNFVPQDFVCAGNVAAIHGTDGRVIIRTFNSAAVYTAEKWATSYPLSYEGRQLNVQYLLYGQSTGYGSTTNQMLYDADSSRFYLLVANGFNANTGSVRAITTNASFDAPTPDDLSAYDVVYCQLINSKSTNHNVFAILKEKETGNYFYYRFSLASNNLNMLYAKDITCTPVPADVAALMKDGSKYLMPPTSTTAAKAHLLIVSPDAPNKLYVTNTIMDNTLFEYKAFDANITAMRFQDNGTLYDLTLGLGLENGKFYLLDASLDALDANPEIVELVKWEERMEGKIVDLFQKVK